MPIRPDLPVPESGAPMPVNSGSEETLRLIATRRSVPVAMLGEPGPSRADIDTMLKLAARVPDHRKLEPWRFIVFTDDARNDLGDIFADGLLNNDPDANEETLAKARNLAMRAPTVIAVISSPVDCIKGTPVWEQELSCGAACQNLMLAAHAMGWSPSWISEWPAFDLGVAFALGMEERERIAGFIYIGTATHQPVERPRPEMASKVTYWGSAVD